YRSQGVHIHDKHVETIARQMLRRVKVTESGDTDLLPNDYVDRFTFDEVNARSIAQGGDAAVAQSALLGVTKASLFSESFLARASFQETTRVLTESAISGARDRLLGLKENVIIGKLIPAGTGLKRRAELAEHQRLQAERQALVASGVSSEFPESVPSVFPTASSEADVVEEDDSFFSNYTSNVEEDDED
ncbi:MAG: DNA-directed RNA polymerase subunit beta', partial [Chloroflexi bacterium]|nr:DNA-directed RNA polymerase subunit beta' [Chloroflexota bacterium]